MFWSKYFPLLNLQDPQLHFPLSPNFFWERRERNKIKPEVVRRPCSPHSIRLFKYKVFIGRIGWNAVDTSRELGTWGFPRQLSCRCSRVRVRRVVVPKNIQPARTKYSWTTTPTGKLSSFSLDPHRSSNFSLCFSALGLSLTALAEAMARYASIDEPCWCHKLLFESIQLFFWSGGPVNEDAWTKSTFSTVDACWSVFKLDYHQLTEIAQNEEAFDAFGKITHGTFIGARAHMKKHSTLERLSCLQSVFLRLSNSRCLMIHSTCSRSKGWAPRLMHSLRSSRNFKSARTPLRTSKARAPRYQRTSTRTNKYALSLKSKTEKWTTTRAYEFVHELLRGWNCCAVTPALLSSRCKHALGTNF